MSQQSDEQTVRGCRIAAKLSLADRNGRMMLPERWGKNAAVGRNTAAGPLSTVRSAGRFSRGDTAVREDHKECSKVGRCELATQLRASYTDDEDRRDAAARSLSRLAKAGFPPAADWACPC